MRGKRAKALRTVDRPHPGRKHGGAKKKTARVNRWKLLKEAKQK